MKGKFQSRAEYYRRHEAAKAALRLANARKPIQEKIREVIALQRLQLSANPKFAARWQGILPWKI